MPDGRNLLLFSDRRPVFQWLDEHFSSIFDIEEVQTEKDLIQEVRRRRVDLVLLDVAHAGTDIPSLIKIIRDGEQTMEVIVIVDADDLRLAVPCIRAGAYDCITFPPSPSCLRALLEKAVAISHPPQEKKAGLHPFSEVFNPMVTQCPRMHDVFGMVEKVACSNSNVLIIGESGTGKELIAQAVHRLSLRGHAPYVPVDCGAIPESLMESELFGHEKGAFTGANFRKMGKFECADQGTLFLDEVSNISYDLQAKLLRVLQERVIHPLGGNRSIPVNVRIIAACNVNLASAVEKGKFRQDLYFRLKVVPIDLPPLRERKEDLLLLAEHFLQKFNLQLHKQIKGFSEPLLSVMGAYDWPGNVREMENLIERMVVLGKDAGVLTLKDLPVEIVLKNDRKADGGHSRNRSLKETCKSFERQVILQTLDEMGWNRTKTARVLKIHRNTLNQKLQDWDK